MNIRYDICGQRLLLLQGHGFVGGYSIKNGCRGIYITADARFFFFLGAGDHDQILNQSVQPVNLPQRRLCPLCLSVHQFFQLCIGTDDRQRGLEFVAGVGDEHLLAAGIFNLRPDHSSGSGKDGKEGQQQSDSADHYSGMNDAAIEVDQHRGVHNNDNETAVFIHSGFKKIVFSDRSKCCIVFQNSVCQLNSTFPVH